MPVHQWFKTNSQQIGGGNVVLRRALCAGLFLAVVPFSAAPAQRAHGVEEADALVAYAKALAVNGEVAQVGEDGLRIHGSSLTGEAVRRPSDALARAAEIYAEHAHSEEDLRMMQIALGLWRRIRRPHYALPYLRLYSRDAEQTRVPFALFCHIQLAKLYEQIGDHQSADEIYEKYRRFDPATVLEVYAVASLAERLLELGRTEEAQERATTAVQATNPSEFKPGAGGDGFSTALAVLRQIPGAEIPGLDVSSGSDARASGRIAGRGTSTRRNLLNEIRVAHRAKDHQNAIAKSLEYQRRFPNEDAARRLVFQAAGAYETLNQPEKAMEVYSMIAAKYPEFPEGWQSTLKTAAILESGADPAAALRHLQTSREQAQTPAAAAQITLAMAELHMRQRQPDDAVAAYLTLLTEYSDQDAAAEALDQLMLLAPRSRDWRRLSDGIKDWFTKAARPGSRNELRNLSLENVSRIRRIVLGFHARNDDLRGGVRWLGDVRRHLDPAHEEHLVRDEAWLLANAAQQTAVDAQEATSRALADAIGHGVNAWDLAPKTEEGLLGLQSAHTAATCDRARKRLDRDLEDLLLELMDDAEMRADAYQMLAAYYSFVGNNRLLDNLRSDYAEME